jgi:hypothetical protein
MGARPGCSPSVAGSAPTRTLADSGETDPDGRQVPPRAECSRPQLFGEAVRRNRLPIGLRRFRRRSCPRTRSIHPHRPVPPRGGVSVVAAGGRPPRAGSAPSPEP